MVLAELLLLLIEIEYRKYQVAYSVLKKMFREIKVVNYFFSTPKLLHLKQVKNMYLKSVLLLLHHFEYFKNF